MPVNKLLADEPEQQPYSGEDRIDDDASGVYTHLTGTEDTIQIPPPTSMDFLRSAQNSGAVKELLAFSKDSESWMRRWKWGASFVIAYQSVLFIFTLIINWGWAKNVLDLLWQSGREGTKFHLNDGVLIALVTTSVANFLALVLIIARNLFPGRTEK